MINSVNDSLVELLICQRSGFDTAQDKLFFNLQHERVQEVLSVLDKATEKGEFASYNYAAIALFCLIDWILFRELTDLSLYPSLRQFHQTHAQRKSNLDTAPKD
jgi:glutathione S-transferase